MNTPPPYPTPEAQPKTEPLATVSLVLGLLGVFCLSVLTGIPAILCGHVARGRIERSNGALTGSGVALAGAALGYLSILLAIVGGLFLVQIWKRAPQLQSMAAQPMIEEMTPRIREACLRYRTDHKQFPTAPANNDEEVDAKALFQILATPGDNGTVYYSADGNGIHINGLPCDTWAQPLHVALDLNGDGKVNVGGTLIDASVVVWSSGPNKQNDHGTGDDVKSW